MPPPPMDGGLPARASPNPPAVSLHQTGAGVIGTPGAERDNPLPGPGIIHRSRGCRRCTIGQHCPSITALSAQVPPLLARARADPDAQSGLEAAYPGS